MKRILTILLSLLGFASAMQAQQHPRMRGENFQTETPSSFSVPSPGLPTGGRS